MRKARYEVRKSYGGRNPRIQMSSDGKGNNIANTGMECVGLGIG